MLYKRLWIIFVIWKIKTNGVSSNHKWINLCLSILSGCLKKRVFTNTKQYFFYQKWTKIRKKSTKYQWKYKKLRNCLKNSGRNPDFFHEIRSSGPVEFSSGFHCENPVMTGQIRAIWNAYIIWNFFFGILNLLNLFGFCFHFKQYYF